MEHCVCEEEKKSNWFFIFLLLLPLLLVLLISSIIGYLVAKEGNDRRVVRAMLFPANFIASNFVGGMTFYVCDFLLAVITKGKFFYSSMGDYLDLTLFVVWGRVISWFYSSGLPSSAFAPNIPAWHIVVFQVVVWLVIGRAIATFWTTCIMKLAHRE